MVGVIFLLGEFYTYLYLDHIPKAHDQIDLPYYFKINSFVVRALRTAHSNFP